MSDYHVKYYQKNKDKLDSKNALWRKNNPDKLKIIQRNAQIKHTFGMTQDEYNSLFAQQNGSCAMCGKHQKEFSRKLDIDHCHTTGQIRGLLCMKCNVSLGKYEKYKDMCEAYLSKAIIKEDA